MCWFEMSGPRNTPLSRLIRTLLKVKEEPYLAGVIASIDPIPEGIVVAPLSPSAVVLLLGVALPESKNLWDSLF